MSTVLDVRRLAFLAVAALCLGQGCPNTTPSPPPNDTDDEQPDETPSEEDFEAQLWFDEAWRAFDQDYAYFSHKAVDWDAVKRMNRDRFARAMSADEFAAELGDVLEDLHDWNIRVVSPDGTVYGYDGCFETNFPGTLRTAYTRDGTYASLGDNVIQHAWVGLKDGPKVYAHIVIHTFGAAGFSRVSQQELEALFATYDQAVGMIIDVRASEGGREDNAMAFASRFLDEAVIYGYSETRNGPGHDDRDPAAARTLEPGTGTPYRGRVACLVGERCSAATEWFALMMRAAGAWLIGDTTRGSCSDPIAVTLSNGVICHIPNSVAYTDKHIIIEGNGILPHFAVQPRLSCDLQCDYVLEFALSILSN
jgi:hypothetical protein